MRRRAQVSTAVVSVIAVVIGLVLVLGVGQEPQSFGWFAYQPVTEIPPEATQMVLNAWGWTGVALIVLGIVGAFVALSSAVRSRRSSTSG